MGGSVIGLPNMMGLSDGRLVVLYHTHVRDIAWMTERLHSGIVALVTGATLGREGSLVLPRGHFYCFTCTNSAHFDPVVLTFPFL
jgi:hypothetical protein